MVIRQLIVIFFLLICSNALLAFSNPSGLITVPHAATPERGQLIYGAEIQGATQANDYYANNVLYVTTALDDYLQVGIKSTSEFDILFAGKLKLATLQTPITKHHLTLGAQNLNWSLSDSLNYSYPAYTYFSAYTIELPEINSFYHTGFAYDRQKSNIKFIAGSHYNFKRFTTLAEWDGYQVNFGIIVKGSNRFNYTLSVTPIPTDSFGSKSTYLSVGIQTKTTLFKKDNKYRHHI